MTQTYIYVYIILNELQFRVINESRIKGPEIVWWTLQNYLKEEKKNIRRRQIELKWIPWCFMKIKKILIWKWNLRWLKGVDCLRIDYDKETSGENKSLYKDDEDLVSSTSVKKGSQSLLIRKAWL